MKLAVLIIGMMLVTYIPRMVPLVFLRNLKLSPYLTRVLRFLPACALGALIAPDAFSAVEQAPLVGVAAVVVAAVASLVTKGLLIAVVAGVGTAYLLLGLV